ncbi:hypothetical protein [Streptomyces sp. NP-1717]|uniref:hypothetical protein n=1 Tax=Streptomyces sp. NP-1717 TaxID=2704470 RepID=UPI001F5DA957|nr:hypothetical protein [Streptomyces sp. NP-1717]MCI3223930.1 hypothetical protein [Streptomyces sp. NP-1717]
MNTPVNRTILLLDIERYSDRDDIEQSFLRRMLYDIADQTLDAAGIDSARRLRADRGDSVMELIDANAPVSVLLRTLLTEVPVQLRKTNRMASSSAQIRLRAVLATGYVAIDAHDGWVGSDLNHACRLLDAQLLRDALRERPDDFALCVSDSVHQGIVRHGHPGIRPEDFHHIAPESKNGRLSAWLHGTAPVSGTEKEDEARTSLHDVAGESVGATAGEPAASHTPGATHITGDQYGVAGGNNHGGLSFSFDQRTAKDQS